MVVVLVVGSIVWRHDRSLWFFGLLGLAAAVLSLGVGNGYWAPWRLFVHLPVLEQRGPGATSRSSSTLCVAVLLAVVVDHARAAGAATGWAARGRVGRGGGAVALVALVPVVVALWPNLPMTVRAVVVPRWFAAGAPALPGRQVVLPYPAALGGIQSSMAWQAMEGMTFSMVGGGGPGIAPSRAGPERARVRRAGRRLASARPRAPRPRRPTSTPSARPWPGGG